MNNVRELLLCVTLCVLPFLGGCYQLVDGRDIRAAVKVCGSIENILTISAEFTGVETVQCMTGNAVRLHRKGD
jgi:hypothetical protein